MFFKSILKFFTSTYKTDTWDIHSENTRSDNVNIHIYTRQNKEIYEHHKGYSQIYNGRSPKAPVLTQYYPADHTHSVIPIQLHAHIPLSSFIKLPVEIREEMEVDGVDLPFVKIFVVGQLAPSEGKDFFIGFYPHYGTEPKAPISGNYHFMRKLKLMITGSDSKEINFECMPGESEVLDINNVENTKGVLRSIVEEKSIITHLQGDAKGIVLSLVPIRICGLTGEEQSFYTYVSYSDEGVKKAIVTLHLLWNNSQSHKLNKWGLKSFGLGVNKTTRSTEELTKKFGRLIDTPEFKGREHLQKFVNLLKRVSLKEALSSPRAFEATFDSFELATIYNFFKAHYAGMSAKTIVKNILKKRGYKDWKTLSKREQDWVVSKISLGAERVNLKKLIDEKNVSNAYYFLKKSGNASSDEEIIEYLLKQHGYDKWSTLSPFIREWIITRVKSEPERVDLKNLIDGKNVSNAYYFLKKSGNVSSDEEIIEYLLKQHGYDKWSMLSPFVREWTITRVKLGIKRSELEKLEAERRELEKLIDEEKISQIYQWLKDGKNEASDEEIIEYLLKQHGYEKWCTLSPFIREWVVAMVTGVAEEMDLEKALHSPRILEMRFNQEKFTNVYVQLRALGNEASKKDLVAYILDSRGYKKWERLSYISQAWVIAKITGEAEEIDLEKALANKEDLREKFTKDKLMVIFRFLKDSFRTVQDEEIISHILNERGYKNWAKFSSTDKKWVTSTINEISAPVL